MKHKTIQLSIFFALIVSGLILSSVHTYASENINLEVMPVSTLLNITQKDTKKSTTFSLINKSDHPQTVTFEVFPIEKIDKNTNRLIYQSKSSLSKPQQSFYQNAISFSVEGKPASGVVLSPKQTKQVEVSISYDNDQSESEYYFTLGFIGEGKTVIQENKENSIQTSSAVRGGVGSHVVVSLGDKETHIVIGDITAATSRQAIPNISMQIENQAKNTTELYGNISINNIFGKPIATFDTDKIILLGNQEKEIHIPSDVLREDTLLSSLSLGPNTIHVQLYDEDSHTVISRTSMYLYLPIEPLLLIVGMLIAAIFITNRVKRRLK